jgi:hypothetical protein
LLTIYLFADFTTVLQNIFDYKGSVNFYMFHGGTNFGFMNGGNIVKTGNDLTFPNYAPTVTSYGKMDKQFRWQIYSVSISTFI